MKLIKAVILASLLISSFSQYAQHRPGSEANDLKGQVAEQVPAEVYKQLCWQLELAYEDMVQSKDAIIKAQLIKIIQLKQLLLKAAKERK